MKAGDVLYIVKVTDSYQGHETRYEINFSTREAAERYREDNPDRHESCQCCYFTTTLTTQVLQRDGRFIGSSN